MNSADSPCYRLAGGVLSVPVEKEAILLSIDAGRYYGVQGAMRHLLEDLRVGVTLEEMTARTCARYAVSTTDARNDLETILPRLLEAGIVEAVLC